MIARLFALLGSLVVYLAVGTLVAEGIMLAYFWSAWQLDRPRLIQALAVAQGVDLMSLREKPAPKAEPTAEQPSYQQVIQARAMKIRNLELREQSLHNALEQLRADEQALAVDKSRYQRDRSQFEAKLTDVEKLAQSSGVEQNRGILARLAPKQARELLMQMLKKGETNDVVALLRDMPDGGRAKILKEFKTPEEAEKLDEVLRLIRQGVPEATLAKQAQDQLKQPDAARPAGP